MKQTFDSKTIKNEGATTSKKQQAAKVVWSARITCLLYFMLCHHNRVCESLTFTLHSTLLHRQTEKIDRATTATTSSFKHNLICLKQSASTSSDTDTDATVERLKQKGWAFEGENVCVYKRIDGQWKRRKDLDKEIQLCQRVWGYKLQTCDLLDGQTGPKIFFECGVGYIDPQGKWHIVHGMMRLGPKGMKPTVIAKRLKKFNPPPIVSTDEDSSSSSNSNMKPLPPLVPLYVSKIDHATKRFEVVSTLDEANEITKKQQYTKKIPFSSLQRGQEMEGTILQVKPYGAIIDIGAQIPGILHITRVQQLLGKFIEQEEGMKKEAGIVPSAKVRVSILDFGKRPRTHKFDDEEEEGDTQEQKADNIRAKVMQRFIELDFTNETKESIAEARRESMTKKVGGKNVKEDEEEYDNNNYEELYDEDDDDYYDEDRDIEDALGLGSY